MNSVSAVFSVSGMFPVSSVSGMFPVSSVSAVFPMFPVLLVFSVLFQVFPVFALQDTGNNHTGNTADTGNIADTADTGNTAETEFTFLLLPPPLCWPINRLINYSRYIILSRHYPLWLWDN